MICPICRRPLDGTATSCPRCGTGENLFQAPVPFHDLGLDKTMSCPCCSTALGVIEFDLDPPVRIERCTACRGLFFNPGEIEALLAAKTNPLGWLDSREMDRIGRARDPDHEPFYRPCPMCSERMSHLNFGSKSGVIVDRCGTHGVWLDGSQLRRLTEWWHSGGDVIHRGNQGRSEPIRGAISPPEEARDWSWVEPVEAGGALLEAIVGILSSLAD